MRALGYGWLVAAAAGAAAPRPVAIMIITAVVIATAAVGLVEYEDYQHRLNVATWAETGKWLDWRDEMREMGPEVDAQWDGFVPGRNPTGSKDVVHPVPGRVVNPRIPQQRQGRAS